MEAPDKGMNGAFAKEIQPPPSTYAPGATNAAQLEWETPTYHEKRSYGIKNPFAGLSTWRPGAIGAASSSQNFNAHNAKSFARRHRKWLIVGGIIAIIAILAIGLGAGLGTKKSKKPKNLPLPSNTDPQTGDLTYYEPGLGACGITSSSEDNIVAMSHYLWDELSVSANPNANPICGRKIRATRFNENAGEQRSVDLTVVDRCVGCQPTDIDTTTTVFDQLAPRESGRVLVTWAWLT